MMTEAEAKTKWCPLSRYIEEGGGNRSEKGIAAACECIASACMAWRWQFVPVGRLGPREKTDKGYCGAFGESE